MTLEELQAEFEEPKSNWLTLEERQERYKSKPLLPPTYLENIFFYLYESMARRGLVSVYDLWRVMGLM